MAKLEFVTFDLTSAKDFLEKLRREIDRAEIDDDREHAGDHVINAFWTAWHLHEWVWDAVREQPELKAAVFAKANIAPAGIDNQIKFGGALARANGDLEIARIIATSSKHVHVALEADSPRTVLTDFSMGPQFRYKIPAGIHQSTIISSRRWIPKVTIDGKKMSARDILDRIDAFWVSLIYGCKVEAREK